jgi:hypothetical protein
MNLTKLGAACCALFFATSIHAAKPHPISTYIVDPVSCICDVATCTVSWTDAGADSYGVDVEFEAEWVEGDVDMSATAELDLDENWSCDGTTCSATGDFTAPDVPADADVSFKGKVKGMATGRDGDRPRDFVKTTADCTLI